MRQRARQVFQSRPFLLALRLGAGFGLLGLSLLHVDLPAAAQQIGLAHPGWVGLAFLSIVGSTALKIVRWGWLLRRLGFACRWERAAGSFLVGQAANVVLPMRGGELVRAGLLGRDSLRHPTALGAILAATVLEKYADLVALAVLLALLGSRAAAGASWQLPAALGLTFLLVGGAWLGPRAWPRIRPVLQARLPHRLQPLWSRIDQLAAGAGSLPAARALFSLFVLTGVTWVCMALTNLLVLRALHLPPDTGAAWLVLALVYVGVVPALMPGNVGPFYFFAMLGLATLPISAPQRAAFAALLHALVTLPPLLAAAVYLLFQPRRPS